MKTEQSSFEFLPQLDADFERGSPLSFSADCPSLSSSFFSTDLSIADCHGLRRPSMASCSSSASPDVFFTPSARTTSPITPVMGDPSMDISSTRYMKPVAYLSNCHPIFHLQDDEQDAQSCVWMNNTSSLDSLSLLTGMPGTLMADAGHSLYNPDNHGLSIVAANPALTKSIFGNSSSPTSMPAADHDHLLPWNSSHVQAPAETIEPSVTFQPILPSSPGYKLEPSTPLHAHIPPSAILSSSPLSMVSPAMVPSQRDVEEMPYDSLEQALRLGETKRHRTYPDRLHRRGYERKHLSGTSSKPKPASNKSGINCDAVIAQNEFACSYPGCIDKNTGKQKRFKRQEHKKRHEKTVHEKSHHSAYKCWVPECNRPFSRTDNLKSHLRNTHSKRPGVRGNRYVATLDKNSDYYDPEWVGELDKHGYPVL